MKVIYIHHAQRDRGIRLSQDDDITKLGEQDAHIVARLTEQANKKYNITAIYSSTFFRCKKTAEIVNQYINVPIIDEPRLNEAKSNPGETWLDTQKRIIEALDEIVKRHSEDEAVICVTSGINLSAFVCKLFNVEPSEKLPRLGVPSCSPILFDFPKK